MVVFYLVLNGLLLGSLVYTLRIKHYHTPFLKRIFWPALLFKLGSGLLLGWLYQRFYGGGDTFMYQHQAELLNQYAHINFRNYLQFIFTDEYKSVFLFDLMRYKGYSNSYFMVWWLHLLNYITGYHYYLNSLYFSLFSFYGCWRLTAVLGQVFPTTKLSAAVAFLFLPSVVFWSSGILKESILIGSTTLLLALVLELVYLPGRRSILWFLVLIAGAYFCFKIRYYFAVAYFPLLTGFAVLELMARRWAMAHTYKIHVYVIAILLFGFLASFLHEAVNPEYFFRELIKSYFSSKLRSEGKAIISLPDLEPTFNSILNYAPKAISSAIFRPLPGEILSPDYWLAGLENAVILLLTIIGVSTIRKNKVVLPVTLILSLFIYVLLLAWLIGLTSANLGSVSRYKVAFMPFLLYLILQMGYNQNLLAALEKWSGKISMYNFKF